MTLLAITAATPPPGETGSAELAGPVLPGPNGTASTVRTALLVLAEIARTLRLIDFEALDELADSTGEHYDHRAELIAAGRAFTGHASAAAAADKRAARNPGPCPQ